MARIARGLSRVRNVLPLACAVALALPMLGLQPAGAVSPCDPATNAKAVAEAREGLGKARAVIDFLRKEGLPVPPELVKAANRMNIFVTAGEIGVGLGEAAGQFDYAFQKVTADLKSVCKTLGDEFAIDECEIKIERRKIFRAFDAFRLDNPGSIVRRAVRNWFAAECDKSRTSGGSASSESDGTGSSGSGVTIKLGSGGTKTTGSGGTADLGSGGTRTTGSGDLSTEVGGTRTTGAKGAVAKGSDPAEGGVSLDIKPKGTEADLDAAKKLILELNKN